MASYNLFEVVEHDGVTILRLANPQLLERLLVNELGDELVSYIESEQPTKLLISFENVTYCSSEVIGSLIRASKRVNSLDGEMKFCGMNDTIRELFKITRLDGRLFDICDSKEIAIEKFAQAG